MPDYKQMYLEMFRATERAMEILIAAQQKCEAHYISATEPEITVVLLQTKNEKNPDEA